MKHSIRKILSLLALCLPVMAQGEETVTYSKDIAPILFSKCANCHRPGEAAPFSLLTYEDAASRARMLRSVTQARVMPPWKAAEGSFAYANNRSLSQREIDLLAKWAADGAPLGDPAEIPETPKFPADWQLGVPDLIVEMPEAFPVPADGADIYRSFAIPLNLSDDIYVSAIELRPSARPVVHHVVYYADSTGAARRADEAEEGPGFSNMRNSGQMQMLGEWAVGTQPAPYQDGIALRIARGTDLVLQGHYVPNGTEQSEKMRVGIYLAKQRSERTLLSQMLPPLFGQFAGINIPAGEKNFEIRSQFTLPVDSELISVMGHAHYIGKSMLLTATLPDGKVLTLLDIPQWDFSWQDRYLFSAPVKLPQGTRIDSRISWDNSADNPHNPNNPPINVRWGENSADEMGTLLYELYASNENETNTLQQAIRLHIFQSLMAAGGR
ncbi:hypothetical protein WDZ92_07085 [Nostoc sp. NIES-2111]